MLVHACGNLSLINVDSFALGDGIFDERLHGFPILVDILRKFEVKEGTTSMREGRSQTE